ncbi:MAG: hypothetical protein M1570_11745 [Chloroflexi bacterium]|nr:hypothetical protein [Chloroflexota bacterium]
MCRFLLAKSDQELEPQELLAAFAGMCRNSRAPDGDWQGDGWGVAWRQEGEWKLYKSLQPIWEDAQAFAAVPPTRLLVAHARSAGFPDQKGILAYNQPYVQDSLCFVFNGMIRGVRLPQGLEGEIGAQKIFAWLRQELERKDPAEALQGLDRVIRSRSRRVVGMNIGVVREDTFGLLCDYGDVENAAYFGLNYLQQEGRTLVCSEPLAGYPWNKMSRGQVRLL